MGANFDDDDYVFEDCGEPAKIAAGDTSFDLMTCCLGQLSDNDIANMDEEELANLLCLSRKQSVVLKWDDRGPPSLDVLQTAVSSERDRCREKMA